MQSVLFADAEVSLPTITALDIAVAAAMDSGTPTNRLLVLTADRRIGLEVAGRCEGAIDVVAVQRADQLEPGELGTFPLAIWIAPDRSAWRVSAQRLDAVMSPGGCVVVIGSGFLSAPLGVAGRRALRLVAQSVDAGRIGHALGYRTLALWSIFGTRSVAWAVLRLFAHRLGRADLADRFEAGYRESLVMPGDRRACGLGVWAGQKRNSE